MSARPHADPVVQYAVAQSVTEVALGSIVHAFKIPMGGHLLSLNQALLLTLATKHADSRKTGLSITSQVANTAAVLKALSPVGEKLTPMLAISVQGFLFASGILVLGTNLLGVIVGSMLLSVWSYVQPLLIAWVIFGNTLWSAIEKLWMETAHLLSIPVDDGKWILIFCISLKALVAAAVSCIAWTFGKRFQESYLEMLEQWSSKASLKKPSSGLKNIWYLLALAMSVGFFIATNHPSAVATGLYILRIAAITLAFLWILRALPDRWTAKALNRFPVLEKSVAHLKQLSDNADRDLGRGV